MVHSLFKVHMLNDEGVKKANELAEHYSRLAEFIENEIPKGREQSIALTHLQQSSMHAKRGIAEKPENQKT